MRPLLTALLSFSALTAAPLPESLRPRLAFHASFDGGVEADFARGDRAIYNAADYKGPVDGTPGLGMVDAAIEKGTGVAGTSALRFRSKNTRALYYRGERNVSSNGGTLSLWLRLDPQKDLAPGFSDPIQVTDKAYNDSAIWVDFSKDDVPRHFRLGVFGTLKAWNPADIPPDKNPDFLRRLIVVERPPFGSKKWTHVAVTWSGLGGGSGSASLFLDGKLVSSATGIREPFDWDPARLSIRLGLSYTGLMDEVAVFDSPLTASEIGELYRAAAEK